ncbi:hypothetical protein KAU37_03830 [Candidatus Bipolaricaulota bacterium]|nr:hypothetical protein [Candidatus Bipolaricaulota bacterium]
MTKNDAQTALGTQGFVLALIVALLASLTIPAYAHVPSGVSDLVDKIELLPIWIFDENEKLYKFQIEEDDLRGYSKGNTLIELTVDDEHVPDGSLSVCEILTFRVLQLAFSQLWPEEVPNLAGFAVRYGHPSKGSKATFEYITRAFSREEAEVDLPEGVTRKNFDLDVMWYEFTNLNTKESLETRVQEGVFPEGFFKLRTKVKTDEATESEKVEFAVQWEEVRDNFLTWEPDALFELEEEEKEPAPIWSIVFALGLTAVVLGTTIYSMTGRGKQ